MPESERRLAAILSADIAGYSRLMADDEAAALDHRLKAANDPPPTFSLKAYDAYLTGRSAQNRQTHRSGRRE